MSFSESRTSQVLQGSQPVATDAMTERYYSTQVGQFELAAWDGTNRSRIQPVCDKVVVLVDQAVGQTSGGIIIADEYREQRGMAATTGVLAAVGPQAFAFDSNRLVHWAGARPKAGDRVFFTKYSGNEYTGADGLVYRLMEDRCIGAIQLPESEDHSEEVKDVGNVSGD